VGLPSPLFSQIDGQNMGLLLFPLAINGRAAFSLPKLCLKEGLADVFNKINKFMCTSQFRKKKTVLLLDVENPIIYPPFSQLKSFI
jgi:hypothetical protein